MTTPPEAQVVANYAQAATTPHPLGDDGRFFVVTTPDQGVEIIDLEVQRDRHRDAPARKVGTTTVEDADSFVGYLTKHGDGATEVFADAAQQRVVAVLDAHGPDTPDWGQHRLVLAVRQTDAWKAWLGNDGQLVDQTTFAEHIEDHAVDIVAPSGADMLELAQTIEITGGSRFVSSRMLSSGERQFEYREQVDGKAGRAGRLDIPKQFTLGLAPFEGSDAYRVTARFRYRLNDGNLRLGYRLERPGDVLREAFADVVADVAGRIDVPIFRGVSL